MIEKIQNRIAQAIEEKVFPACTVGIIRTHGERIIIPVGKFTFDNNARAIEEDTIFDVASITKSIPTSSLALKLIDENKISLEDKLISFVPEFSNFYKEEVLIKHLLTQTLDYNFRLSAHKNKTPEEILNIILTTEFKNRPGTNLSYANVNSILLGLVIERVFGKTLDELGDKYFFRPLKMMKTSFYPLRQFAKEEIVPTEEQEWRGGLVQGEVHDESAYALMQKMTVGSAGLFSTVPDLLNFLEMLLNNGFFASNKYFSTEIIQQMQTNQLAHIGQYTSLGWELNQPRYMGKYCSERTFGKTGFTGCSCVCDIKRGVGLVILSNYTFPVRKPDATLINKLRIDIANIVFENL